MLKEPVYLTFFEVIHTRGFIKIMTIIWSPLIMCMLIYLIKKGLDRRGR